LRTILDMPCSVSSSQYDPYLFFVKGLRVYCEIMTEVTEKLESTNKGTPHKRRMFAFSPLFSPLKDTDMEHSTVAKNVLHVVNTK